MLESFNYCSFSSSCIIKNSWSKSSIIIINYFPFQTQHLQICCLIYILILNFFKEVFLSIVCVELKLVTKGTCLDESLTLNIFAEQNINEVYWSWTWKNQSFCVQIDWRIDRVNNSNKGTVWNYNILLCEVHDMELHVTSVILCHCKVFECNMTNTVTHQT